MNNPEEDQELKPRENQEITLSDPIQPEENLELTPGYIQPLVHMVEVKQSKSPNGRRKVSMCYNFQLQDGTTMQVCNEMFSSTPGSIYTL